MNECPYCNKEIDLDVTKYYVNRGESEFFIYCPHCNGDIYVNIYSETKFYRSKKEYIQRR